MPSNGRAAYAEQSLGVFALVRSPLETGRRFTRADGGALPLPAWPPVETDVCAAPAVLLRSDDTSDTRDVGPVAADLVADATEEGEAAPAGPAVAEREAAPDTAPDTAPDVALCTGSDTAPATDVVTDGPDASDVALSTGSGAGVSSAGDADPDGLDPVARVRPRSAVERDAAHNAVLDEVRAELAGEARAFARRVDLLLRLGRLQSEGALAGQAQAPELEMAGSWSVSQLTAATWAADADRYATCLPVTLRMLGDGTLLLHQARVLLTRTRHCPPDVCRAVEAEVLPEGALLCPADLRKRVDRLVLRLTSEQTDPAAAEQRHADTVASRRTFVRADVEGMAVAAAVLTAEQSVAWQAAMDRLERRERAADRAAGVTRTADQRRADIFAALPMMVLAGTAQDRTAHDPSARDRTVQDPGAHDRNGRDRSARDRNGRDRSTGSAPGTPTAPAGVPRSPVTTPAGTGPAPVVLCDGPLVPWTFTPEALCAQVVVHVHVPVATVLDLAREPGTVERYGPVSAEHVRLVRPHSYRRVLVDAATGVPWHVDDRAVPASDDPQQRHQQILDMLRPTTITDADEPRHDPSASLARLVDLRDQHCCGPGCTGTRCDRDHLRPHPDGPTCADNLGLLSRRCHRAKHHGWTLVRHPDGTTSWTSPLGRTYTRPGPHARPPRADLTTDPPPLRPRPTPDDDRWVIGHDAPPRPPEPPRPQPEQDTEPPF